MSLKVYPPVSSGLDTFDSKFGIPRPLGWVPQTGGFIEAIASATVTDPAGVTSISFTSIPQTYDSLLLFGMIRTTEATTVSAVGLQFNGDTAANYASYFTIGDGSTASSTSDVAAVSGIIRCPGSTAPALTMAAFHTEILDYSDAFRKTYTMGFAGHDQDGAGRVQYGSLRWNTTTAVTSVQLVGKNSSNIAQNSTVALFGVRSAAG